MALPAELRLDIYEYVIQAALATALSHSGAGELNLLQVSRRIRGEVLPIFLRAADAIKACLIREHALKVAAIRARDERALHPGQLSKWSMLVHQTMGEWEMRRELEGSFEFRTLKRMVDRELAHDEKVRAK